MTCGDIMNNFKQARKRAKLTQSDVAKRLNVDQSTYSYWEAGKRNIDANTLAKLAELYGVSTDYLLGRTDEKKPPESEDDGRQALANASDETKLALELMNRLTPENRAKAMDHLDYLLARQEGPEDTK